MTQKRVVIVKGGQWGDVKPEDYDRTARSMKGLLEQMTRESFSGTGEEEKIFASVEIVDNAEEARKRALNAADIFIFLSRSQTEVARIFKKERPWTKVVVYTGLIPDYEIIWMSKDWPPEAVRQIIAHL